MRNEVVRILSDLGEMDHPQRVRYYLGMSVLIIGICAELFDNKWFSYLVKCLIDRVYRFICSIEVDTRRLRREWTVVTWKPTLAFHSLNRIPTHQN